MSQIFIESWHPDYHIVVINDALYPTKVDVDWKPPLIAHWGRDFYGDTNKEKLMYVWYPKDEYTKEDIERIVFIKNKYDSCPMCIIGRDIINKDPMLKFKYKERIKSTVNRRNLSYFIIAGIFTLPVVLFGIKHALDKKQNNINE